MVIVSGNILLPIITTLMLMRLFSLDAIVVPLISKDLYMSSQRSREDISALAESERLILKVQGFSARGGQFYAVCDLCQEAMLARGVEMHELIRRSHTNRHSQQRALTYQKEVCALLCPTCHRKIHDSDPGIEQKLWRRLFDIFGRKQVEAVVDEIIDSGKSDLYVNLPED